MGWRAIRIGLDRPAMLRQQLRALLRAAGGRELLLKFPMIAEIAELEAARRLLDKESARAAAEGHEPPRSLKLGVMLEVPSLLWQLPALLKRVDFLSIGSNDLAQFLFACDRGNPRLAERYDLLSAPMVALCREVVAQCRAANTPLSMCGEMAGNPIEAMVLIALGFRTLSVTATAVGPVKTMIRSLDAAALGLYLGEIGDGPDHSLRRWLEAYASASSRLSPRSQTTIRHRRAAARTRWARYCAIAVKSLASTSTRSARRCASSRSIWPPSNKAARRICRGRPMRSVSSAHTPTISVSTAIASSSATTPEPPRSTPARICRCRCRSGRAARRAVLSRW